MRWVRHHRTPTAVVGLLVLLAVIAGSVVAGVMSGRSHHQAVGSEVDSILTTTGSGSPAATTPSAPWCAGQAPAGWVASTGDNLPHLSPAQSAVVSFEHAYYVDRDGTRARGLVAPAAPVRPAEVIQKGIDTIPAGTHFCVAMSQPDAHGAVAVNVFERHPDGTHRMWAQQFTVSTSPNPQITAIASRKGGK